MNTKKHPADFFWDIWCVASVIGIWPRFIEPNLLAATHLNLDIPKLPKGLQGLTILQFTDLHWNEKLSPSFLNKLLNKVEALSPDIIVFTGDFLCYSHLSDPETLYDFLCAFSAPYGCYAVLGNHDYEKYVSVNSSGDYDIIQKGNSPIKKGWKRFFTSKTLTKKITDRTRMVPLQKDLVDCLKESPFELLHNESKLISIKDTYLNICGLGEYTLGRCQPEIAYKNYDPKYPGVVLLHNPDGLPLLKEFPGDIVLCGHTHGGQVNLLGLSKKFMYLENTNLKRGFINYNGRKVYVNRGVGGVMPFRWCSKPELLMVTLNEL